MSLDPSESHGCSVSPLLPLVHTGRKSLHPPPEGGRSADHPSLSSLSYPSPTLERWIRSHYPIRTSLSLLDLSASLSESGCRATVHPVTLFLKHFGKLPVQIQTVPEFAAQVAKTKPNFLGIPTDSGPPEQSAPGCRGRNPTLWSRRILGGGSDCPSCGLKKATEDRIKSWILDPDRGRNSGRDKKERQTRRDRGPHGLEHGQRDIRHG